jgi:hypothetical protein
MTIKKLLMTMVMGMMMMMTTTTTTLNSPAVYDGEGKVLAR